MRRTTQEEAQEDGEGLGDWASILANRSPEGRAVVAELRRAEEAALGVQARLMAAMKQCQACEDDLTALTDATAEVDRMRRVVHRLAIH